MLEDEKPLDENFLSEQEHNIPVPAEWYGQLRQTAQWARILSICNFAGAGFQLLSMFILLDRLRLMMRMFSGANNYILFLIILYLILIAFTALIGWHLWNYASHLKTAVEFEDSEELEFAYYYQYRYFKSLGWLVISGLILIVIAIALFIYIASISRPY